MTEVKILPTTRISFILNSLDEQIAMFRDTPSNEYSRWILKVRLNPFSWKEETFLLLRKIVQGPRRVHTVSIVSLSNDNTLSGI